DRAPVATEDDRGVEVPANQHVVAQLDVVLRVEALLDLRPALAGDLPGRAVDGGLAVEDPRRKEVRDVDGEDVPQPPVAVGRGEVTLPEDALVDRGQRPRALEIGDVPLDRVR